MSASLVGSEMCIRDSRGCRAARSAPEAAQGRQSAGLPGAGGHAIAPVSYTHLTLPTICSV
eukprot:11865374-Alexandrium_andersonii.AAC.1